jgi:hypothetical protein
MGRSGYKTLEVPTMPTIHHLACLFDPSEPRATWLEWRVLEEGPSRFSVECYAFNASDEKTQERFERHHRVFATKAEAYAWWKSVGQLIFSMAPSGFRRQAGPPAFESRQKIWSVAA